MTPAQESKEGLSERALPSSHFTRSTTRLIEIPSFCCVGGIVAQPINETQAIALANNRYVMEYPHPSRECPQPWIERQANPVLREKLPTAFRVDCTFLLCSYRPVV